ncbi:MAG: PH domain-containing protein [Planctomycetota bacterium]
MSEDNTNHDGVSEGEFIPLKKAANTDEFLDSLPPDEGPEMRVVKVRPSCWKGRPFSGILLMVLPVAAFLLIGFFVSLDTNWLIAFWVFLVLALLCWGTLAYWWITTTLSMSLSVTNKRVTEHRGLLSKSTDEVLIDHIRNVQVHQGVVDRIMGVGRIGISSAGQDDIEIQMADIPKPHRLKDILDRYRSLG